MQRDVGAPRLLLRGLQLLAVAHAAHILDAQSGEQIDAAWLALALLVAQGALGDVEGVRHLLRREAHAFTDLAKGVHGNHSHRTAHPTVARKEIRPA